MPNHTIINTTTSTLDMSPLCDLLGRRLTLRSQESRDVDDKTFSDEIIQRVIRAKWLVVKPQSVTDVREALEPAMSSEALEALGAPAMSVDVPETSTPTAPIETAVEAPVVEVSTEPETVPAPAVEPVAVSEVPVETPAVSEKPLVETAPQSANKANKRR